MTLLSIWIKTRVKKFQQVLLLLSYVFKHGNEGNPKHISLRTVSAFDYVSHFRGGQPIAVFFFSVYCCCFCIHLRVIVPIFLFKFFQYSTVLQRREGDKIEEWVIPIRAVLCSNYFSKCVCSLMHQEATRELRRLCLVQQARISAYNSPMSCDLGVLMWLKVTFINWQSTLQHGYPGGLVTPATEG